MGLLALGSDNLRRLTLLLKYADRLPALIEALASGAGERSSVYTRLRTFKLSQDLTGAGAADVKWMIPDAAGDSMIESGESGQVRSHLGIYGKAGDLGEAKAAGTTWWVIQLSTDCPEPQTGQATNFG